MKVWCVGGDDPIRNVIPNAVIVTPTQETFGVCHVSRVGLNCVVGNGNFTADDLAAVRTVDEIPVKKRLVNPLNSTSAVIVHDSPAQMTSAMR